MYFIHEYLVQVLGTKQDSCVVDDIFHLMNIMYKHWHIGNIILCVKIYIFLIAMVL